MRQLVERTRRRGAVEFARAPDAPAVEGAGFRKAGDTDPVTAGLPRVPMRLDPR